MMNFEKNENVFEKGEKVVNNDFYSSYDIENLKKLKIASCEAEDEILKEIKMREKNDKFLKEIRIRMNGNYVKEEEMDYIDEPMPNLKAIKENLPNEDYLHSYLHSPDMAILCGVKATYSEKLEIKELFEKQVDRLSKDVIKLVGKVSELVNLLEKI